MAKAKPKTKKTKKKIKKNVVSGRCYVKAGFGNTIVTITDQDGGALCWSSAGLLGFKGSRKATPFAAQMAAENVVKKAIEMGMKSIDVFLNGPGAGRDPVVRTLSRAGVRITSLQDVTPIPHNGCRPPKMRRI